MRKIPQSDDYTYDLHEYGLDLRRNHIYLFGNDQLVNTTYSPDTAFEEPGVEFTMANRFIKNVHACLGVNPGKEIVVHMKTNGGDWVEGMAIVNTIKACPVDVTALVYTHARSMSSLIFLACDRRLMMPDSYFMFHEGTIGFDGTMRQFRTEAKWNDRLTARMIEIYCDAIHDGCGEMASWSNDRIQEWLNKEMSLKEEVYLTAEQAVDMGFADEVFTGSLDELYG